MADIPSSEPTAQSVSQELRDLAKVLRQALLMIVRYLEKRYGLGTQQRE